MLILLLAILHQDFWWWDDPTPVLGFLPVGFAWHVLISALSALAWWLATRTCWPEELEEAGGVERSDSHNHPQSQPE